MVSMKDIAQPNFQFNEKVMIKLEGELEGFKVTHYKEMYVVQIWLRVGTHSLYYRYGLASEPVEAYAFTSDVTQVTRKEQDIIKVEHVNNK